MRDEDTGQQQSDDADTPRSLLVRRSMVGLPPLPLEGLLAIEAAIEARTPAGVRLENLLAIGEEIGAQPMPTDDFDRWGAVCQRLDAMAYALRLLEAQIIAGNTGSGMLLPNQDLLL